MRDKSLPVSIIEQYCLFLLPKCISGITGLPFVRTPILQVSERRISSFPYVVLVV